MGTGTKGLHYCVCTRVSHFCTTVTELLLFPCPISLHSSRNIFHLFKIYTYTKVRNCDAHRYARQTRFHYRFFENLRLERHNMGMNLLIPYIMQKVSRECNSLRNIFNVTNKKRERKNFRMFHNFERVYTIRYICILSHAHSSVIKCICLAIRRKNFK